jgi:hypothetical protein
MVIARSAVAALAAAVVALAGCDSSGPCPVSEVRQETVDVPSNAANMGEFVTCEQGDCTALCTETAERRVQAHVVVDSCARVQPDAGAPDAGQGQQVTLQMTYRVYRCGT